MNDSYTSARLHVMLAALLDESDFSRLKDTQAVLGVLAETHYAEDITRLQVKDLQDLGAIDTIIASNRDRALRKLERISSKSYREQLQEFLRANDIWNVKVVAEAIAGGVETHAALREYGRYGSGSAAPLAQASTLDELAQLAEGVVPHLKGGLSEFLDTLAQAQEQRHPVMVDEYNLLLILRLIRQGLGERAITERLKQGGIVPLRVWKRCARARNLEEARGLLRQTPYAQEVQEEDLVAIEDKVHKRSLERIRIASRKKASLGLLQRFLVEQELEHERLRLTVKGRLLGVEA